jgi:hypothetical protein
MNKAAASDMTITSRKLFVTHNVVAIRQRRRASDAPYLPTRDALQGAWE